MKFNNISFKSESIIRRFFMNRFVFNTLIIINRELSCYSIDWLINCFETLKVVNHMFEVDWLNIEMIDKIQNILAKLIRITTFPVS